MRFLAQKAKENSLKPEDYEVSLEFGQCSLIMLCSESKSPQTVSSDREEHSQSPTWEDHLASNSSVPSSIHLKPPF